MQPDRGQTAHPHQHLAIAGYHHHRQAGLRQRKAQSDHHGAAHRAPEVKIAIMVAGSGDIVGRGAKPADHDRVLALRQQARDDAAPIQKICLAHLVKTLAPIRRCDNRTAVGVQAL